MSTASYPLENSKSPLSILAIPVVIIAFFSIVGLMSLQPAAMQTQTSRTAESIYLEIKAIPHNTNRGANHDPYTAGSEAETIVKENAEAFTLNGGPNGSNLRCAVLKIGGVAQRYLYWKQTHVSKIGTPYGNLSWTHLDGTWGGAFPMKSLTSLGNVPTDIAAKFASAVIEISSTTSGWDNCPPPPPLLQ